MDRSHSTSPRRVRARLLLAAMALVVVVGCGGGKDYYTGEWDDEKDVALLVSAFKESLDKPTARARNLAADVVPQGDQLKLYKQLSYKPQTVSFSDPANAVITVLVRDPWGSDITTIEWKAVKEADAWKLVAIPLPEIPPEHLPEGA